MDKKISIIVPVYNTEQYLRKCLNSIINQTYQNIEVLLIDDGSKDDSKKICYEYASMDNRIKVIAQENAGVSAARNRGLDAAEGDFVLFVDSDDYIELAMCEELLRSAESADVVVCGVIREGIENGRFPVEPISERISSNEMVEWLLLGKRVKSWACNKLISKKLITNMRFDEKIKYQEDVEFFLRLFSSQECSVLFIPFYGYHYCVRKGSLSYVLDNRLTSYEAINNGILMKLRDSQGLLYRRTIIYMHECRLFALKQLSSSNKNILRRNISFIRQNLASVSAALNKNQYRDCRLIAFNYKLYCLAVRFIFKIRSRSE